MIQPLFGALVGRRDLVLAGAGRDRRPLPAGGGAGRPGRERRQRQAMSVFSAGGKAGVASGPLFAPAVVAVTGVRGTALSPCPP